jgi:hypothetical protein
MSLGNPQSIATPHVLVYCLCPIPSLQTVPQAAKLNRDAFSSPRSRHSETTPTLHSTSLLRTIRQTLRPPNAKNLPRSTHIAAILIAAGNANLKLTSIGLADLEWRFFELPVIPKYNAPLRASLSTVQSLHMRISLFGRFEKPWLGNLASFIKHLELVIANGGFTLSGIFAGQRWSSLCNLVLRHILMEEDDLVDLVFSHRASSFTLELHACPLVRGDWPSVFFRLKEYFVHYKVVAESEEVFHVTRGSSSFVLKRFDE